MHTVDEGEHVHDDELLLHLRDELSAPFQKRVADHLSKCYSCRERMGGAFAIAIRTGQIPSPEKRRESRFAVEGDITFVESVVGICEKARLRNVSRSGLGIEVRRYLVPGTELMVRLGDLRVFVKVSYTVKRSTTYLSGLKILEAISWNK